VKLSVVIISSFLLNGCALFTTEREAVIPEPPPFYTQAEVDALNAEIQCKNLARNPVQIARCSTKR
jgi:hypothetical protein